MTWSIEITSPLEQMYDVEFEDVEAELKDEVEEWWSFVVDCSVVEAAGTDGVLEAVVVEVIWSVVDVAELVAELVPDACLLNLRPPATAIEQFWFWFQISQRAVEES